MSCRWLMLTLLVVPTYGMWSSTARAQTIEDAGWWTAVFSQGEFSSVPDATSRWRWWFDGHTRFQNDSDGFDVSIVRPGIGYKLTDNTTAWMDKHDFVHDLSTTATEMVENGESTNEETPGNSGVSSGFRSGSEEQGGPNWT